MSLRDLFGSPGRDLITHRCLWIEGYSRTVVLLWDLQHPGNGPPHACVLLPNITIFSYLVLAQGLFFSGRVVPRATKFEATEEMRIQSYN
jgi:hypothetical protein